MQVSYRGKILMNHSKNTNTILSTMIALAVVGISSTAEATEPAPVCGNGDVEEGEECDDDNTQNGDGCDEDCQEEDEEPECGDGEVDEGEECDDGDNSNTDACLNTCEDAFCGDGFTRVGVEECDDGNNEDDDGCSAECTEEEEEPCRDDDEDGVCDNVDRCLGTEIPEDVPTTGKLNPNHYALVDDDLTFNTTNPMTKQIEESSFTIADTGGCSCEQILDEKPGNNEGQYKFGCSEGTIKNAIKDAQAGPPEGDELDDVNDPPQMDCNMGGQTSNGAAWALFGLVLAVFGRRRRP